MARLTIGPLHKAAAMRRTPHQHSFKLQAGLILTPIVYLIHSNCRLVGAVVGITMLGLKSR